MTLKLLQHSELPHISSDPMNFCLEPSHKQLIKLQNFSLHPRPHHNKLSTPKILPQTFVPLLYVFSCFFHHKNTTNPTPELLIAPLLKTEFVPTTFSLFVYSHYTRNSKIFIVSINSARKTFHYWQSFALFSCLPRSSSRRLQNFFLLLSSSTKISQSSSVVGEKVSIGISRANPEVASTFNQ
jgi:hypothetical protein